MNVRRVNLKVVDIIWTVHMPQLGASVPGLDFRVFQFIQCGRLTLKSTYDCVVSTLMH